MKKFSMAPIQKYTSHRYEKMCFVPNFRRISASRQSNKSEKITWNFSQSVYLYRCIKIYLKKIFLRFLGCLFFGFMCPWGLNTCVILSKILNSKLTIWYLHSGKFTKFCTRDEFLYSKVQYGQILLLWKTVQQSTEVKLLSLY